MCSPVWFTPLAAKHLLRLFFSFDITLWRSFYTSPAPSCLDFTSSFCFVWQRHNIHHCLLCGCMPKKQSLPHSMMHMNLVTQNHADTHFSDIVSPLSPWGILGGICLELQWFSHYSQVDNMTRLVIFSRREWFNGIICSTCRGSLIKGQAELEWFGSISSPLLRTNVAICVRRVEWKIIAFIIQVQCTDICSWIKHFYSSQGHVTYFP